MAGEQPPDKVLQGNYVYLKGNLIAHSTLIDELLACGALTDEEKADYRKITRIKCGALLKRIIRKGPDACSQAIAVLQNTEYGIYKDLQQRNHTIDIPDVSLPANFLEDHRSTILKELEPTKTVDYLFQYGIFNINIHDEIETEKSRMKKAQLVLHHLKNKLPDCVNTFIHVLNISEQEEILSTIQENRCEQLSTPADDCVKCVRINFRWIRNQLHFELTVDHLLSEKVIEECQINENRIERGRLVKKAIKFGPRGCESLLRCLDEQQTGTYKRALEVWKKRKSFDPRTSIDITMEKVDLDRHQDFFVEELDPLEVSDILFEENVLTVTEHDNIEEEKHLKKRNELLLGYLKRRPDNLPFFIYALKETGKEFLLESMKNRNFHENPPGANSQVTLLMDQGVLHVVSEGSLPEHGELSLIIKEVNNPDSTITKMVTVLNNDPNAQIEVVQATHMAIKDAHTGSVVIHMSPLTDTAIVRFFRNDGTVVQEMLKKLLLSTGLQDMFKKGSKELEMSVKISKKEPSLEEKIKRSQDPNDIMRRKMLENEACLVDELEPSELTSFLVQKETLSTEGQREIELQRGRRQRGRKLLEKIRTSSDPQILESFKEFLDSIGRKDLIELVQASDQDKDDHEKAESIRNILLPNYTNVVEEIETTIIKETLQKFVKNHNIEEEYKSFLPETGKSRQDRVHRFLTFVFRKDEYVIELEKVFRQNNLDHLLEAQKQEDYFGIEEPSKKRKLSSSSTLKEGELFDCTYKVVLSEGPGPKGLEKMEVDYPQPAHREQSHSFDTPKGHPSGSSDGEKKQKYTHELEIPASSATTSESTTEEEPTVVVAIDFGTTYSGFAYALSKSPSEIVIEKWNAQAADSTLTSLKTPTSLLLDNENNFLAFGYEAERKYKEYAEDNEYDNIRFFRNFKMQLHQRKDESLDIIDHMGKPLKAMEVFSKAIEYLKEKFLKSLKNLESPEKDKETIAEKDIHWVVTVPAIWDEYSKKFMRKAAEKAGIPGKQLSLALEPEVAAIHVLMDAKMVVSSQKEIAKYEPGAKLLVADLGGGTADFSVMEITKEEKLSHLHYASGGQWGGENINEEIFNIFTEIFGHEVMKNFKDAKAEILEMENDIELKKREMKIEKNFSVKILPIFTNLCKDIHKKTYKAMIEESKYAVQIKVKSGGKLEFSEQLVHSICEPVAGKIAEHIKKILENSQTDDVKTIILVGGFAESKFIDEYIRKTFKNYDVKIPTEAGLAVLKGAVRYGQNMNMITERVCDDTYGVEAYRSYTVATDPDDKIKIIGGKKCCTGVFQKIIEIGKRVRVDEEIKTEVKATTPKMTEMEVNIYRSKKPNPLFITDDGCERFASMKVKMPITKGGTDRVVTVGMTLGRTEITFLCHDKTSGNKEELSVKYYG